jgi:hypothetical protein
MTALHELTIKAIRRAQSQGGIVDPVEDFPAIAELDRLARAGTEIAPEERLLFLDLPIVAGNASLYRLSWGASDWVTQLAIPWFRDEPSMLDRAILWAHAHSRDAQAFRRFSNSHDARLQIEEWSRGLTSSYEALLEAADQLCPKPRAGGKESAKTSGPISNGPVIDRLMDSYKQQIDYFIWDISAEALEIVLAAGIQRDEKQEYYSNIASGHAPAAESRLVRSIIKFQRAAKEFVRVVTERNKGAA